MRRGVLARMSTRDDHPVSAGTSSRLAARRYAPSGGMEILVLTTVLPHGRVAGGEIGTHAVLDALAAAGHSVTVVGYRRANERRPPPTGWVDVGERPLGTREGRPPEGPAGADP